MYFVLYFNVFLLLIILKMNIDKGKCKYICHKCQPSG